MFIVTFLTCIRNIVSLIAFVDFWHFSHLSSLISLDVLLFFTVSLASGFSHHSPSHLIGISSINFEAEPPLDH